MAAPTVRAVGTVASGTGAITPGLPAGTVAGDLLIMFLETSNQTITVSGWTQAPSSPQSYGAPYNTRLTVFYKIAVGADTRTTSDSGNHQIGRIIGITKGTFNATTPFNTSAGGTSASTPVSIPGSTTSVDECLIVAAASNWEDTGVSGRFGSWTNANLTSITERIDNNTSAGDGGGIGVATGIKATAGDYGTTTMTPGSVGAAMISLAIQPPAAVGSFFGASASTFTLSRVTAGKPTYFAASATTETLSRVTAGAKTTFTSSATDLAFAATSKGGIAWFGAASSTTTLDVTTAATRTTFGVTDVPLAVSTATAGTRTTFSSTAETEVLTVTTDGVAKSGASVSTEITFTVTTAGHADVAGVSFGTFDFEATTAGVPTKFAALVFGLFPGPDVYPGPDVFPGVSYYPAVSRTTSFGGTSVGTLGAHGAVSAPFGFGAATYGFVDTPPAETFFGAASSTFTLARVTAGSRETFATSVSTYTLTVVTQVATTVAAVFALQVTTAGFKTTTSSSTATWTLTRTASGTISLTQSVCDDLALASVVCDTLVPAVTSDDSLALALPADDSLTLGSISSDSLTLTAV